MAYRLSGISINAGHRWALAHLLQELFNVSQTLVIILQYIDIDEINSHERLVGAYLFVDFVVWQRTVPYECVRCVFRKGAGLHCLGTFDSFGFSLKIYGCWYLLSPNWDTEVKSANLKTKSTYLRPLLVFQKETFDWGFFLTSWSSNLLISDMIWSTKQIPVSSFLVSKKGAAFWRKVSHEAELQ